MGKYTMEVNEILRENKIFDFDYPIYDETYREQLEENILNYYYFHEIGVETIGRFIFNLKARLNLIMPYYNQMYESTLLEFDPLMNYQVSEVYTRNVANTGATKGRYSDTPQGRTTLEGSEHLTDITEGDSEDNADETFNKTMEGNIGVQTYAALLKGFRQTFINVDKMIIAELQDLFMQVY